MKNKEKTIYRQEYSTEDRISIFFKNDKVTFYSVFESELDDGKELFDDVVTIIEVDSISYINAIAKARLGYKAEIQGINLNRSLEKRPQHGKIKILKNKIELITHHSLELDFFVDFDSLFLDSFSVVENSESQKRSIRIIKFSPVEKSLIDLVRKQKEIIYRFSPREFEIFIGALLSKLGYYNVKISRYCKDGGYDIYAIQFDGEKENVIIIEVKHYLKKNVGIEIVDRLNGVRDRESAQKGIIVTSSKFSTTAKKYYASNHKIEFMDFNRIIELLNIGDNWSNSEHGLWTNSSIKAK